MAYMLEILITASAMLVLFGLGGPFALVIDRANLLILSLPLGFIIASILVTALYLLNFTIPTIRLVVILTSFGGVFCLYRNKATFDFLAEKYVIGIYFAVLFLLIMPVLVGGVQFAVFQGNHWDQFFLSNGLSSLFGL